MSNLGFLFGLVGGYALLKEKLALHCATDLCKRFEGFYADAYYCPAGHLTVGYGHVIHGNDARSMTEKEASDLLNFELKNVYLPELKRVLKLRGVQYEILTHGMIAGMLSAVYNAGGSIVSDGTWVDYFKKFNFKEAKEWFVKWNNNNLAGLVRRRFSEWELIMTGRVVDNPKGWREYYDRH